MPPVSSAEEIARTDAFWMKVDKREPDECWPWLGTTQGKDGRGYFFFRGFKIIAPRYSFYLANGRFLEKGEFACHSCDNPSCVNPAHIWAGDAFSNMQDAVKKGRLIPPSNSRGWQRSLTHCLRGHEFTPENTIIRKSTGRRACRTCARAKQNAWQNADRQSKRLSGHVDKDHTNER